LCQAHAVQAISRNGGTVNGERVTTESLAIERCSTHAAFYALDQNAFLGFGKSSYENDKEAPHRAVAVHVLPTTHKLDSQAVEFIDDCKKMFGASCDAVE
jgi:hypothetical protein